MTSSPLITAKFWIGGKDLDISEITQVIGVEPSGVWYQRRPELRERRDLDDSGWYVGFENRALYDTDEAVRNVLETIWPVRDKVRSYLDIGKGRASMLVNVTIHEERPIYGLSADTMERLAYLRCEFCMDLFDYSK